MDVSYLTFPKLYVEAVNENVKEKLDLFLETYCTENCASVHRYEEGTKFTGVDYRKLSGIKCISAFWNSFGCSYPDFTLRVTGPQMKIDVDDTHCILEVGFSFTGTRILDLKVSDPNAPAQNVEIPPYIDTKREIQLDSAQTPMIAKRTGGVIVNKESDIAMSMNNETEMKTIKQRHYKNKKRKTCFDYDFDIVMDISQHAQNMYQEVEQNEGQSIDFQSLQFVDITVDPNSDPHSVENSVCNQEINRMVKEQIHHDATTSLQRFVGSRVNGERSTRNNSFSEPIKLSVFEHLNTLERKATRKAEQEAAASLLGFKSHATIQNRNSAHSSTGFDNVANTSASTAVALISEAEVPKSTTTVSLLNIDSEPALEDAEFYRRFPIGAASTYTASNSDSSSGNNTESGFDCDKGKSPQHSIGFEGAQHSSLYHPYQRQNTRLVTDKAQFSLGDFLQTTIELKLHGKIQFHLEKVVATVDTDSSNSGGGCLKTESSLTTSTGSKGTSMMFSEAVNFTGSVTPESTNSSSSLIADTTAAGGGSNNKDVMRPAEARYKIILVDHISAVQEISETQRQVIS